MNTETRTHRNTALGDRLTVCYRKYGHLTTVTCTVSTWDPKVLVGVLDNGGTLKIRTDAIVSVE